jgi:hypothetical protein
VQDYRRQAHALVKEQFAGRLDSDTVNGPEGSKGKSVRLFLASSSVGAKRWGGDRGASK